ncbi:MAG: hypothetical protein ACE5HJ_04830 [Thermoplasmata archaeon]
MKTRMEPEKIGKGRPDSRGDIKVIDLSQTPSRVDNLTALHKTILDSLRRAAAGILSRDELLERTRGHSFSDVERALRDLSLRGLVKVLWRTPFRFVAYLTEKGEKGDLSPLPTSLGLPA